jgi:hypothetical protein
MIPPMPVAYQIKDIKIVISLISIDSFNSFVISER